MNKKIIKSLAGFLAGAGIIYGIVGCKDKQERKEAGINWVTQTKEREYGAVLAGSKFYYTTERGIYESEINNPTKEGKEILKSAMKLGERNNIFYDNGKLIFFRYEPNKEIMGIYTDILCSYDLNSRKLEELCKVESFPYFLGLDEKGMIIRTNDGSYRILPIDRKSDITELKTLDKNNEEIKRAEDRYKSCANLEEKIGKRFGHLRVLEQEKDGSIVFMRNYDIGFINSKDLEDKK